MARIAELKILPLVAAACAFATAALAQDASSQSSAAAQEVATPVATAQPSSAASATTNPIVAAPGSSQPTSSTANASFHRRRVISPEVAAQLAAAAPKFTAPPPAPPSRAEEDEVDLREVDKPKNGIIRLPKYVVTAPTPAVLNERAVNTKKGLAEIAMKRYMTEADRALNRFTVPLFGSSAESRAMTMYEEDERLRNMSALGEDARMISSEDKAAGLYVKKQVDSTFMRQGDFDWKPIGR